MESLKFGPEWLRNRLSNSLSDIISRPILSEYRYSREEMLGIAEEKHCKKVPEILTNYRRLFVPVSQNPLLLQHVDEEKSPANNANNNVGGHSRLFLNSNHKVGANNWRKGGVKEDPDENWRYPNKENKEISFSPLNSKPILKKSWREKSTKDDPFSKSCEYKPEEDTGKKFGAIEPKQESQHSSFTNKNVEKAFEEIMDVQKFSSNPIDYEILSQSEKIKKIAKESFSSPSADCELNMKKLENDLLMNLTIMDEEKKPEKITDNSQQPAVTWFYVDPERMIQGPFSQENMTAWYQHGFFHDNLMIRRSTDSNFITLNHLIQAFGPIQPFALASSGYPIPKYEHQLDQHVNIQHQLNKKPPPILNQPVQWNPMIPPPEPQSNQHIQFHQNMAQQSYPAYHAQNRQQYMPQIDPRIMHNGNPYIHLFNNMNSMGINRFPPQLLPSLINQMPPPSMKNQMSAQNAVNQFSQSMIQQMPAILPPNPIQKLLYDLQKQKDFEKLAQQNQAMYFQHNNMQQQNNSMILNDQLMQSNNNEINQNKAPPLPYFSNNSSNAQIRQIEKPKESTFLNNNFDADDEGEFRTVGSIKRKKFQQKDTKEQSYDKVKENHSHLLKLSSRMTNLNGSDGYSSHHAVAVKKMNDERAKFSSMPAPWINKVKQDMNAAKNLERIQIEEEQVRKIEMDMKREIEKAIGKKKELESKMPWNSIVTENVGENSEKFLEDLVWNVPLLDSRPSSKKGAKNVRQSNNKESNDPIILDIHAEKENEFKNWCIDMIKKMNTKIDIPIFVNFLAGLESPFEVEDYIKMYLGDCIESTLFTKKFLERRSSFRKAIKIIQVDDDLCAPPKAINPGSNEEAHKANKKKHNHKKSKKTMKFADNNILGFKATAASNRIVGELHEDEF